nr:YPDG domain-containing protein [Staphylococcus felis]
MTVTPILVHQAAPGIGDGNTSPGIPVTLPQLGDTELPPGTKFEVPPAGIPEGWTVTVDPDNGKVTVTPPADAKPVSYTHLTLTTT